MWALTSIFEAASVVVEGRRAGGVEMCWIAILVGVIATVGLARFLLVQVRKLMVELAEAIRAWHEVRPLLQCREADSARGEKGGGPE
ncbi:hypothetical protein ACIBCM_34485 [Streptomyces sp. NPDC051018]|uniref:hypothetical protein n=1 Tax=Streptomyces sp. NPDC051018 TaxID=3365639 RepID=UPI00378A46AB